jgi:hypothetical protein
MNLKAAIILLCLGSIVFSRNSVIAAETDTSVISCALPLDTKLLAEKNGENGEPVITAETISQERMSVPSLWWAKEKIDTYQGKLIDNWLAYPYQKRIDLIVNWQIWDVLDYLQKYALVNDYGMVARSYGYNLRVFDRQSNCLALYYYDDRSTPPQWKIYFNSSELNGWQLKSSDTEQFK